MNNIAQGASIDDRELMVDSTVRFREDTVFTVSSYDYQHRRVCTFTYSHKFYQAATISGRLKSQYTRKQMPFTPDRHYIDSLLKTPEEIVFTIDRDTTFNPCKGNLHDV